MKFTETTLPGAYIIALEEHHDERGFFARAWCKNEFKAHGLQTRIAQTNFSYSHQRGTLRGLHYQQAPHEEVKLVRCIRGGIYDVIVDMRAQSASYLSWFGVELTAENRQMLYVPQGFAHGFLSLCDDVEVLYQVSEFYSPGAEQGLRYDDPAINISWPQTVQVISQKDSAWPDYKKDES